MRIIAPRIGWVRGTGLMGRNDALAPLVEERLGVRTFGADELGWLLTGLLEHPEIDLDGGLSAIPDLRGALEPLAQELRDRSARNARRRRLENVRRDDPRRHRGSAEPGHRPSRTQTHPPPDPRAQA